MEGGQIEQKKEAPVFPSQRNLSSVQSRSEIEEIIKALRYGDIIAIEVTEIGHQNVDGAMVIAHSPTSMLMLAFDNMEGSGIRGWRDGFYSEIGNCQCSISDIKRIEVVARRNSLAAKIVGDLISSNRDKST